MSDTKMEIITSMNYSNTDNILSDMKNIIKGFYEVFPDILDSLSPKSSGQILSWTHYRVLLQVEDMEARKWYEKEAYQQTWSVRTLQRNISSQYYYRMLQTQKPNIIEAEMKTLTGNYQNEKYEFIKNPV